MRSEREPGWLAVSLEPGALSYAYGRRGANGRTAIERCGTRALEGDFGGAERVAKELHLDRYRCSTLLAPSEYQMLLVEAPNVPPSELKNAVRWRVKDLLECHLDDATIDVLDIPPEAPGRAHSMYAVAARNEIIQERIGRFEAARIPLSVIEVAETAQRNIAALVEPPDRGLALLHFGAKQGLVTINFRGELYLARRIEVGADHLSGPEPEEAMNRVVLELQRTFDHFDRQFRFVPVARLLVGPEPEETGVVEHLVRSLDMPVEPLRLQEVLGFGVQAALDRTAEWRLFHLIGAALRHEEKAL